MDNKQIVVSFAMTPELRDWMTAHAKRQGLNRSELARRIIEAYRKKKGDN